jgi:hypothetical protein
MGNLIPGTGLLTKKTDHTADLLEVAGPAGDFVKRLAAAGGQLVDGDLLGAYKSASPVASRNVAKMVDMLNTGSYNDDKGRKVIDTTPAEAVLKGIGFQPNTVAQLQEAAGQAQQMVSLNRMRQTELNAAMAQAVFDNDADKKGDVMAQRDRWNKDNPDMRINVSMPSVLKQVRAMREGKATRIEKASPKGIRQQVRNELGQR